MFGKLMNNFYYGKSGKGDYRKEDLPTNRWQLFGEMLRIRLAALMRLNMMYAVPWLPAMLVMLINALSWYANLADLVQLHQGDAAALQAAMNQLNTSVLLGCALWLIPCLLITGPFTAGVAYVTRNWARDEHAFVWSDFKDAAKENWKQGLGVSAITSVVPLIVMVCWTFYGQMAEKTNMPLLVIPQMITAMAGLVWFLMLIYLYPLLVTYKLTFRQLLRNGFLLAMGRFPHSLGLRLVTLVPLGIGLCVAIFMGQVQWVIFAVLIYYFFIGMALSRFVFASYSNGVFDRFINVHIEGAQVNRGLSPDAADDEDDDEYDEE